MPPLHWAVAVAAPSSLGRADLGLTVAAPKTKFSWNQSDTAAVSTVGTRKGPFGCNK